MSAFGTSGTAFGGGSIDRSVFRTLLPDWKWYVYAAGRVNAGDTNVATVFLQQLEDDGTVNTLGSVTHNTATTTKKAMGPFDLFATAGVPNTEDIVTLRLFAQKDTGADGAVTDWTIWLRLLPARR